jgi:hypothetical protein
MQNFREKSKQAFFCGTTGTQLRNNGRAIAKKLLRKKEHKGEKRGDGFFLLALQGFYKYFD